MDANVEIDLMSGAIDTPDLKQLQGLWVSVEGRRPLEFHIEGRRFHVRFHDGDIYTGWLDVVIDERPRTMIMNIIEGPAKHKGKTAVCIYEFDGELLRWCPAEPGLDDPPDDFPAIDDTHYICTVFNRGILGTDGADSRSESPSEEPIIMATLTAPRRLELKDFKAEVHPDWCPGCGDFGVLNALQRTCADMDIAPHELLVVSGIGCSSNLPGFFRSYGVHSLHGRALPFATGAKLANHRLTVVATGGDGDGYGIGLNHFIQAMRRNINLTYIVMNNEIYGLTTGQVSPTSEHGMVTKSTPGGNLEHMLNPLALALAMGCGYIARGFSGDPKHLAQLYKAGIEYPGFALIDVFSPCVTFNKQNTFAWFKEHVYKLEDQKHDPSDFHAAMDRAQEWGAKIPIGLFYHNPNKKASLDVLDPALKDGPLVDKPDGLTPEQRRNLVEEFM